ncbi:MAG TPA: hydrogenase maturation protease [Bryobacteraceae bacterium]|nr:hydrogenase maturation protease [Bryobacteraceae bacterium]
MPRVLIIGYGSPLRGDDGLGWHAAERLRKLALPGTGVLTVHQLTPELAEDMSRAELVVFIDAREGGRPGEWDAEPVSPEAESIQAFTHHVTPGSLLGGARLLYGGKPEGVLFAMTGESFEYREGLSETVAAALPEMLEAINQLCSASE